MPRPTDEILISLGYDFGQKSEAEQTQLLPGLTEHFGYVEAFTFLAECVDSFMSALHDEYPNLAGANGVSFWDDYHSGKFTPGGVLAYDASHAILAELAENDGGAKAQRVGQAAYRRLKVDTYKPVSVEDLLKTLLNP